MAHLHPLSASKVFIVRSPLTIVGGALMFISVLVIVLLAGNLTSDDQHLLLLTIIGLVGNAVPSVLGLLKSEAAHKAAAGVQHDLENGAVKEKVIEAVHEMANDDSDSSVVIVPNSMVANGNDTKDEEHGR